LPLGNRGREKLGKLANLLLMSKVDILLQFMLHSRILARAFGWVAGDGSGSAGAPPSGTIGLVFALRGSIALKTADFSGVCAVQVPCGTALAGSASTLVLWFGAPGETSLYHPYRSVTEARGGALVSTAGSGVVD